MKRALYLPDEMEPVFILFLRQCSLSVTPEYVEAQLAGSYLQLLPYGGAVGVGEFVQVIGVISSVVLNHNDDDDEEDRPSKTVTISIRESHGLA